MNQDSDEQKPHGRDKTFFEDRSDDEDRDYVIFFNTNTRSWKNPKNHAIDWTSTKDNRT